MSKVLIGIMQAKRVVLPHLFLKYSLPVMEKAFRETCTTETFAVIFQHQIDRRTENSSKNFLETRRLPWEYVKRVKEWTRAGRFAPAQNILVKGYRNRYPMLHNWQALLKYAIQGNFDYAFIMEDDAFAFDPDCGKWLKLVAPWEMGRLDTFQKAGYILTKSAWLFMGIDFIKEILNEFLDWEKWNCRQKLILNGKLNRASLEPALTLLGHGKTKDLSQNVVARFHRNSDSNKFVVPLLQKAGATKEEILMLTMEFQVTAEQLLSEMGKNLVR